MFDVGDRSLLVIHHTITVSTMSCLRAETVGSVFKIFDAGAALCTRYKITSDRLTRTVLAMSYEAVIAMA